MNSEGAGTAPAKSPALSVGEHSSVVGATENVDRIREILFGSQMREYEQRLTRLEDRLSREIGELNTEVRRRLDSLEGYTKQEVEALSGRLTTERSERTESTDRMLRELTDGSRALERRLIQSEDQVWKDLRELRQLILEHQRTLSEEVTQLVGKSEILQNRRLEEVRANAVNRIAFGNLLAEIALRIRGESLVPGMEDAFNAGAPR